QNFIRSLHVLPSTKAGKHTSGGLLRSEKSELKSQTPLPVRQGPQTGWDRRLAQASHTRRLCSRPDIKARAKPAKHDNALVNNGFRGATQATAGARADHRPEIEQNRHSLPHQ
ncbi:MAG: hypothetical protein WA870_02750, partial [Methylovirgula sp.]